MRYGWEEYEAVPDLEFDLFETVAQRIAVQRLRNALPKLPQAQERLVRRTFGIGAEQTTLTEAAHEVGMKVANAHHHRGRALKQLRRHFGGGPCPI